MGNKPGPRRLLLTLLFLFFFLLPAFAIIDARHMKAFGREEVKLYCWNPIFDKVNHCIYDEFFFRSGYRDEKGKMEEAGFDTSASAECTKWTEWCVLRIDPHNVEYIEYCSMGIVKRTLNNRAIMELCGF